MWKFSSGSFGDGTMKKLDAKTSLVGQFPHYKQVTI
jgi:hypothetical protein